MARFAVKIKDLHATLGDIIDLDRELQKKRELYNELVTEIAEEWISQDGYPEFYLIEFEDETRLVQLKRNMSQTPGEPEYHISIEEIEVVS